MSAIENIDIDCTTDLTPDMGLVTGSTAIKQAIVRRILTPRGALWYAPNYGFDVRTLMNAPMTKAHVWKIRQVIVQQALADERVTQASCATEWHASTGILTVALSLVTYLGEVSLTLAISDVTVELLGGVTL